MHRSRIFIGDGYIRTHFKTLQKKNPSTNNIHIEKIELQLKQHAVTAHIYKPKNIKTPMPIIIFHPGGGLALDMTEEHAQACITMNQTENATVICIQPPLAPENKFPEILNAAYDATDYFYKNADQYGLDTNQFIITGYSMGGTLATLITNRIVHCKTFTIAALILISGVLDITSPPLKAENDFMFDASIHLKFIEMCLPVGITLDEIKNDVSFDPMASHFSSFPATYLITGEYDAFKADSIKLAELLQKADVPVSLTITADQIHNTLLLHSVSGDSQDPVVVAGEKAKEVFLSIDLASNLF